MPSFSPVSSNKLYIQIYNQIKEAILRGDFSVGDKLPSEKEFCEMFGVSRVPVREALSALELNGLVESVHGAGVFVKQVQVLTNDWVQGIDPQDIIRARQVLEPEVARAAAQNITEVEKARLAEILDRFRQETEAGKYSDETDEAFHCCIGRASGNQMYVVLYDMIWKAMEQKMWHMILNRTVASERYRQKNYEEHTLIGRAILAGDAESAYTAMKNHMENLELRYWD